MTTMISEVYTAFRSAGVPEETAKLAAEALATKDDINKLEKELIIIKWMIGLVIIVQVLPFLKGVIE